MSGLETNLKSTRPRPGYYETKTETASKRPRPRPRPVFADDIVICEETSKEVQRRLECWRYA